MLSNLDYFEYCRQHPENQFDLTFAFLDKDPHLQEYVNQTKKIKEYLITIKVLKEHNAPEKQIDDYLSKLQTQLGTFSNRSEFVCFAHACDTTLEALKKNFDVLKRISLLYIEKRDITDITPAEWIQALIDSQSSRKKGSKGEKKLLQICYEKGFAIANRWQDLQNVSLAVAKFSKSKKGDFCLENVRRNLSVHFEMNDPNKSPDLILKYRQKWFLIEAKHLNTSGGSQNKQLQELISFIGIKPKKNVHFIAFLDGHYADRLLDTQNANKNSKLAHQQNLILSNLKKHPQNYWLNTAGFIKWLTDLQKT